MEIKCKICERKPDQIAEYVNLAREEPEYFDSPEHFVRKEEGTYNPKTGLFYCTNCYIKIGMPPGTA